MVLGLTSTGSYTAFGSHRDVLNAQETEYFQVAVTQFHCTQAPAQAASKKHIPVLQGEVAAVHLDHEPKDGVVVSSDEATTCVIAVVHCCIHRQVLAAHIDAVDGAVCRALQERLCQMQEPRLFLLGSYVDERGKGAMVLERLQRFLHDLPLQIELCLFCCGALNTHGGLPVAQGLAYCTATKTAFAPIEGLQPGPLVLERAAWRWAQGLGGASSDGLQNFYDTTAGHFCIPAGTVSLPPSGYRFLKSVLQADDSSLLQVCSTSPEAERSTFPDDIRRQFSWCLKNLVDGVLQRVAASFRFDTGTGWRPL